MKDSVYIENQKKDYNNTATIRKPVAVVLIISVVFIVLLNLINTVIFY